MIKYYKFNKEDIIEIRSYELLYKVDTETNACWTRNKEYAQWNRSLTNWKPNGMDEKATEATEEEVFLEML